MTAPRSESPLEAFYRLTRELEAERQRAKKLLEERDEACERGKVASWGQKRAMFLEICAEARARGWQPKAVGMKFKSIFGHWPAFKLPGGSSAQG